MKFTSIFSASRNLPWLNLFLASWLIATSSCNKSVSIEEQKSDIKAVVQQAFEAKGLMRFLNRPGPGRFVFRYEELPVYNGYALPKPTFNVTLGNQEVITYTISRREESNAIPILIEQVIINHDSAIVNLSIPMQGVNGAFRLGKTSAGSWVVTKDYVAEE